MCEHSKIIEKVQIMRYYQRKYHFTRHKYYYDKMIKFERLVDAYIPVIDLNDNVDVDLTEDELKLLSLFL